MQIKKDVVKNNTALASHPKCSGTLFAVAGADFAIVAIDTDVGTMSELHKQRQNKMFSISDDVILASNGCTCYTLPFVRKANTLDRQAVSENQIPSTRSRMIMNMVGDMTAGRALAYPDITNIVVTVAEPALFVCDPTKYLVRQRMYFAGKGADFLKDTCLKQATTYTLKDIDLLQDKIEQAFNELAASPQYNNYCNETLHIGVVRNNRIRIIEKILEPKENS